MNDQGLSPFCCYYCNMKFLLLEDGIKHTTDTHEHLILKIKSLQLNSNTGKLGYRSHNFNITPKDVKAKSQTIKIEHSSSEISIHLVKSSDNNAFEEVISSPLHKKMRPSIIKDDEEEREQSFHLNRKTNDIEADLVAEKDTELSENRDEIKILVSIMPSILEYLKRNGKLEIWMKFNFLLASHKFPLNNVAFLLFFDVVKWFDSENSVTMRYDPMVTKFWRIGYKLFHGKWLRFMSGPKYRGELVKNTLSKGMFDPSQSKINFAVPYHKVRNATEAPLSAKDIQPGILTYLLDKFAQQATNDQTFKLCFDGKKINASTKGEEGDIDLFGFDGPPNIKEKRQRLEDERNMIKCAGELFKEQTIKLKAQLNEMSVDAKCDATSLLRNLVHILSLRLKELRQAKVTKEMAVAKFKKMAGSDWRKSNFLHVISGIETILFDINVCIDSVLRTIDKLGIVISILCEKQAMFSTDKHILLAQQSNYVHLVENGEIHEESEYRFVKQRSEKWFAIRKKAVVTGSTLNKAVGLESLKLQLQHFDSVIYQKEKEEPSEEARQRMEHGTTNEINAVATIACRILPMFYPDLHLFEEGCYQLNANGIRMVISPDGSCRNIEKDTVLLGVEIKCPAPKSTPTFKPAVHYNLPKYYVPQVLSEMAALGTDNLLYVCYTPESTTVHEVKFCQGLWDGICAEVNSVYGKEPPIRPSKKSENINELKDRVEKFVTNNVSLLCEVPSSKGVECPGETLAQDSRICYHEIPNTNYQSVDIMTVQIWLHECEKALESAYQLTRTRASEFLGFMISDLDRLFKEDELHSVPIAYALKGYSLQTQTVRAMMEYILLECKKRGLYVPVCSFDGQWHRIAVRDRYDNPLTLLQLQKDVWKYVKKIDKTGILKEIFNMNVVSGAEDLIKLSENVHIEVLPTPRGKCIIVGGPIGDKKLNVSSGVIQLIIDEQKNKLKNKKQKEDKNEENLHTETRDNATNDIMSVLQQSESELTADIENQVLEIATSFSLETNADIVAKGPNEDVLQSSSLEVLFAEETITENDSSLQLESNDRLELENADEVNGTDTQETAENSVGSGFFTTVDKELMLAAVRNSHNTKKNWDIGIDIFTAMFKSASTIEKNFTKAELSACMQPILGKLKAAGVKCGKSRPKYEIVSLLSKYLGDGSNLNRKATKRQITPLKFLARKSVHNLSKDVLNCVYSEHVFPDRVNAWYYSSPFGSAISIDQQDTVKFPLWYSMPEYNGVVDHYLFLILDSYHQLCGARRLLCQNGIPAAGIKKEYIHKLAKESAENKCELNVAIAIDLIDKQNVEFAKTTFSEKVVGELKKIGAVNEAKFCQLMHDWYIAEDEPAVSAETRCRSRLALRDWLLEGVNFARFPPYGSFVKDIPVVLYEGLLTNIERKIQLFPFTKRGNYNVRAVGSMDIENFFGTFQDIDPRGAGVLRPADIPTALSVAVELMDAKMDPERGFYMQTSVAKVYPCHPLSTGSTESMDTSDSATSVIDLTIIRPRNHQFDASDRVRGKQKRKKGDVSNPDEPARGIQPVRQHHRRDETKILPHVRRGLNFADFES